MSTVQGHREEQFRRLFADAYEDVLRFAQRRVHPSHAEDVAAEVFLVAWRRLDQTPRTAGDARAWLFGIARHCLLNAKRGQDRQDALAVRISETAVSQAWGGPDPELVGRQIDLAASWRRLRVSEQEVLALTAFDDLTSPQAALVLGISAAAYRLRLMRARRELRRHIELPDPIRADDTIQETASWLLRTPSTCVASTSLTWIWTPASGAAPTPYSSASSPRRCPRQSPPLRRLSPPGRGPLA